MTDEERERSVASARAATGILRAGHSGDAHGLLLRFDRLDAATSASEEWAAQQDLDAFMRDLRTRLRMLYRVEPNNGQKATLRKALRLLGDLWVTM